MTDTIIFDTEPLVAYLDDEPGSDVVEEWIDRVASGEVEGYISPVTKTEILYVGSRVGFRSEVVRVSLERLEELGVAVSDPRKCWHGAAIRKEAYPMALGDAYTRATADAVNGTLLVGVDDNFADIDENLVRFREDSA